MLSGRDALERIDRAVAEARGEADALQAGLAGLNQREVEMRAGMRAALEELARFRLEQSRAGSVSAAVAGVERKIAGLMAAREREQAELTGRLDELGQRIAGLETRRAAAAAAADEAAGMLDAGEQALQHKLEQDAAYQARHASTEKAEAVAVEAEHKHALALDDRRVKGAPYEADALFMYLWARGYGTSAYRGSGLVRMADAWVARLIRFEDARRNYYMLTEIPTRLGEHARRMREAANAEIDALAALESAARDRSDVPELEQNLDAARRAVEAVDAELAEARDAMRVAEAARDAFGRGDDEKFRAAIAAMADALDDDSIAQLRRAARRTRMPEDDAIVERLVGLEEALDDLAGERDQLSDLARARSERLSELEDMRIEFRRRGYDDYGSEFDDRGLFGVMLAEFVRGAIPGSVYWDRLGRSHRRTARRSRPDFGSGGFRFPGPLSFPGARGGGFRTGGGMSRGGGFRTGGGF